MNSAYNKKDLYKTALIMAWPAVLESFFVSLAGFIDTLMVSNLGESAIASVGLITQPKFIALSFFFACNIAISALVARRYGEKNQKSANEILITGIFYTIVMCIIVTFITYFFADTIISWCGSNNDTHLGAVTYFKVIQLGMIFNVLSLCINAAQRGSGNTKITMKTNITSSVVNIVFNFLLIEGHFGFPRLELFGAAFATVLGTVVACIMSIRSLFKEDSFVKIKYIINDKIKPTLVSFKSMISLSINFFLENIAMRIGFLTTAVLAANLGTAAFAAHQVGMNFTSLSFSLGDGMQVAAVALIGRSLGQRDGNLAKTYGSICQKIGFCISLILFFLMVFFGRDLFALFFDGNDTQILDMGAMIMRFIAIIMIFQISQVIFAGCLRGAGDARYTLFASLISVAVIRTIVTWALTGGVVNLGIVGIWTGVLSDQLSRFLFFSIRYHKGKWVEIRI